MSETLLPVDPNEEQPFESIPESRRYLASYPNGKLKLELVTNAVWRVDQPQVTRLRAYDTLGQPLFGMFAENIVNGDDRSWQHEVLVQERDLPVVVKRTQTGPELFSGLARALAKAVMNAGKSPEEITEPEPEPEPSRQQLVIFEYDAESRLTKQLIIELIDLDSLEESLPAEVQANIFLMHLLSQENGLEFGENQLPLGLESHEFAYDESGRIRSVVEYTFNYEDEGEVKKILQNAELYQYQELDGTREVQIVKAHAASLNYKDLKDGVHLDSVVVKNVDPQIQETTAYACYEYADKRKNEIIISYHRAKKHPRTHTMKRLVPTEHQGWVNWQVLPEDIKVSTFITATGIDNFNQGHPLDQIGTPADQENPIKVLYWDEFARYVDENVETHQDMLAMVQQIFDESLSVRVLTSYSSESLTPVLMDSRKLKTHHKRMAYFGPYLLFYADMARKGLIFEVEESITALDFLFESFTGLDLETREYLSRILRLTYPPSALRDLYADFLIDTKRTLEELMKPDNVYSELFKNPPASTTAE